MSWQMVRSGLVTFGLFIGMFFLMSGIVHAAGTGADLIEFTGGATRLMEGLRGAQFIRRTSIALLGLLIILGINGNISGGWPSIIMGVLCIGGFVSAEPLADAIFSAGAVI